MSFMRLKSRSYSTQDSGNARSQFASRRRLGISLLSSANCGLCTNKLQTVFSIFWSLLETFKVDLKCQNSGCASSASAKAESEVVSASSSVESSWQPCCTSHGCQRQEYGLAGTPQVQISMEAREVSSPMLTQVPPVWNHH